MGGTGKEGGLAGSTEGEADGRPDGDVPVDGRSDPCEGKPGMGIWDLAATLSEEGGEFVGENGP